MAFSLKKLFAAKAAPNPTPPAVPAGQTAPLLPPKPKTEVFEVWSGFDEKHQRYDIPCTFRADDNTLSFQDAKKIVTEAVGLLSLTPTGKFLLLQAAKKDVLFICNEKRCEEDKVYGAFAPSLDVVTLNPNMNPLELILTIAHELTHCYQDRQHALRTNSLRMRPDICMQVSNFTEADAFAHMGQVAKEFLQLDSAPKSGQKDKKGYGIIWDHFVFTSMHKLAGSLDKLDIPSDQIGNHHFKKLTMSDFFEAYFDTKETREGYEKSRMKSSLHYEGKYQEALHLFSFRETVSLRSVKRAIKHMGRSYLQEEKPQMDLSQPKFSGLSQESIDSIREFYARRRWNKRQKRLSKKLVTHNAPDVDAVFDVIHAKQAHQEEYLECFLPPKLVLEARDKKAKRLTP